DEFLSIGALPQQFVAGRRITNERRSCKRLTPARRLDRPQVLADFDTDRAGRQIGKGKQERSRKWNGSAVHIDLGRYKIGSGCKPTLFIELAVSRQKRLRHDTMDD